MKYILKNNKWGTFLRYFNGSKHFTVYKEQATKFNKKEVEKEFSKLKHPENWVIIEIEKRRKNDKRIY